MRLSDLGRLTTFDISRTGAAGVGWIVFTFKAPNKKLQQTTV